MDSNPICHPSPTKKMKCLFLYYVQLLMISWAGRWTRTPSATPLKPKKWNPHFCITFNFWWLAGLVIGLKPHQPPLSSQKKWNAYFWITFNFWWSARLVNGLKPHPPPLCRHKMKCLFLHYVQLVMIGRAGQWTRTPSAAPLQQKKWNAHFWIAFNFGWSARLVDGLKPHPPPLSSQKMKCSFLDYVQLLMISQAGQRIPNPSATSFQPKKWNAHFCIMFKFWWSAELVDRLEPHLQPLSN